MTATTYLGLFSPVTSAGNELRDGSAVAVRVDGDVRSAAATEERLSGRRYDPGMRECAGAVLAGVGYGRGDRLVVGMSSCLGPALTEAAGHRIVREFGDVHADSLTVVGHHRAHAAESFASSGFDEAVVLVNDSMGDVVQQGSRRVVECQSVFVARRTSAGALEIELVQRDFVNGIGYGQLFRAVTRYLGFPGYHHAAKVMAIAGCTPDVGDGLPVPHRWGPRGPELVVPLDPDEPIASLDGWLRANLPGSVYEGPRETAWYSAERYRESGTASLRPQDLVVAAWVQHSWERFLLDRAEWATRTLGISKVCLSGGVSLNCVTNALVRDLPSVSDVYVGCAPGDSGQALGNLLTVLSREAPELTGSLRPPYLTAPDPFPSLCTTSARASRDVLVAGGVVAVERGPAEYGPRALGHRSLLALPTSANADRLRAIKRREDYQPFAVVVTDEYADRHLGGLRSPYMSFAPRVEGPAAHDMADVLHSDGTCRIQTLGRDADPWLHHVLESMAGQGLPEVLVNTSLNLRGAPMAHRHSDPAELATRFEVELAVVETESCNPKAPACVAERVTVAR